MVPGDVERAWFAVGCVSLHTPSASCKTISYCDLQGIKYHQVILGDTELGLCLTAFHF